MSAKTTKPRAITETKNDSRRPMTLTVVADRNRRGFVSLGFLLSVELY